MCKESNEDDTKETLQTNEQRALPSLQVLFSCVCACVRFASTLIKLLCLSFCFVSLIQSSSVFPLINFSPLCEFFVIPCNCSHSEHGFFDVLSLHRKNHTQLSPSQFGSVTCAKPFTQYNLAPSSCCPVGPKRKDAKTCVAHRSPFRTPRAGTSAHLPIEQRQRTRLLDDVSAWLSQAALLRPTQVSASSRRYWSRPPTCFLTSYEQSSTPTCTNLNASCT